MTDKVQKIRKEVEKIAKSINPFIPDEDGKNSDYEAGKLDAAIQILQIIDSLEEPVSVWHDASEEPEEGKDFAFVTYNEIMWARYRIEDIFLGWQKFRIQTELDKWAYVSDLLKL